MLPHREDVRSGCLCGDRTRPVDTAKFFWSNLVAFTASCCHRSVCEWNTVSELGSSLEHVQLLSHITKSSQHTSMLAQEPSWDSVDTSLDLPPTSQYESVQRADMLHGTGVSVCRSTR